MKIGIDLDNTLVEYDAAFLAAAQSLAIALPQSFRSKYQVREFLRAQPDGERTWQRVQGLSYGRFAQAHAKIFPGVKRFLWRCRQNGHSVTIVSHKTEYGHDDVDRVPLRTVASAFLADQGIAGTRDAVVREVIFKNTYEEKIACIETQAFDWFIDDLYEVLCDLAKCRGLRTIHFQPAPSPCLQSFSVNEEDCSLSDWQQIDARVNGEWRFPEVDQLARHMLGLEVVKIEQISKGGNAGVYCLSLSDDRKVKMKIYPVDSGHDRLFSEFSATSGLYGWGSKYVARPLARDTDLGVGIYDWITGEGVLAPDQKDLESSLDFLRSLHALRNSPQFAKAPVASAACFSGQDIENQIRHRLCQFDLPRKNNSKLDQFFAEVFVPTFETLISWVRDHWPNDSDFDSQLTRDEQTLSPSDFGFHNAIRRVDGSLVFSDFEYFGWDDPVKLMSDFSFHPAMSLSDEQKASWFKGALDIYGEHQFERLKVCLPLYGMVWCLILLNDFRPEIWQRRLLADDSKRAFKQETLSRQLARAQTLIQEIQLKNADAFVESRRL